MVSTAAVLGALLGPLSSGVGWGQKWVQGCLERMWSRGLEGEALPRRQASEVAKHGNI